MYNLGHDSPQIYQYVMAGYHVSRPTEDHIWGKVSPNHIEKTFTENLKSPRCLTGET